MLAGLLEVAWLDDNYFIVLCYQGRNRIASALVYLMIALLGFTVYLSHESKRKHLSNNRIHRE